MSIQYASQVQVEAAREAAERFTAAFQQLVQGSQRPSRVPASRVTELDLLTTQLNTAVDAIIAAAVLGVIVALLRPLAILVSPRAK